MLLKRSTPSTPNPNPRPQTQNNTAQERSEAVNEVSILASINSPYIVRYYDSFVAPTAGVGGGAGGGGEDLHIVMEYCNR